MHTRLGLTMTLLTALSMTGACATDGFDDGERGPLGGKSDELVGTCAPSDCGGPSSSGIGWCDDVCAFHGDCAGGVAETCGLDECIADAGCSEGERCAPGVCHQDSPDSIGVCDPSRCAAPEPAFCADGTVVVETTFIDSADGMECSMPSVHCVTNDGDACPLLSPLPPDFCADGTVVAGAPSFIDSVDGMECSMPSVHCVTNDGDACPQLSPLPPDFCAGGTVVADEPSYVPSTDGKECALPRVHCVTNDLDSCPLF